MADSEVRQKFEAWVAAMEPSYAPENLEKRSNGSYRVYNVFCWWHAWKVAFEAGMRAGEIAQREKIVKAVCTGCRAGWPEQGRPGDRFVIHVHPESGGLYACQAAAIRALPAAPENK